MGGWPESSPERARFEGMLDALDPTNFVLTLHVSFKGPYGRTWMVARDLPFTRPKLDLIPSESGGTGIHVIYRTCQRCHRKETASREFMHCAGCKSVRYCST